MGAVVIALTEGGSVAQEADWLRTRILGSGGTGFLGEVIWDTTKPNGQPGRGLNVSRAERVFGYWARTGRRRVCRKLSMAAWSGAALEDCEL